MTRDCATSMDTVLQFLTVLPKLDFLVLVLLPTVTGDGRLFIDILLPLGTTVFIIKDLHVEKFLFSTAIIS